MINRLHKSCKQTRMLASAKESNGGGDEHKSRSGRGIAGNMPLQILHRAHTGTQRIFYSAVSSLARVELARHCLIWTHALCFPAYPRSKPDAARRERGPPAFAKADCCMLSVHIVIFASASNSAGIGLRSRKTLQSARQW